MATTELVPVVADFTVENASDEVITDLCIVVTFTGATPPLQSQQVCFPYLTAQTQIRG